MSDRSKEIARQAQLRQRALARLDPLSRRPSVPRVPGTALGVIHGLASSPSTAADALSLLHELQVYQVELDLQQEELRHASAELEQQLNRQERLYDSCPVGLFTIDRSSTVFELNERGASLLGASREALYGRALADYLSLSGRAQLMQLLARVIAGEGTPACGVELLADGAASRRMQLHATADPDCAEERYLVALLPGLTQ